MDVAVQSWYKGRNGTVVAKAKCLCGSFRVRVSGAWPIQRQTHQYAARRLAVLALAAESIPSTRAAFARAPLGRHATTIASMRH